MRNRTLLALLLAIVAVVGVWRARAPLLREAAALWVVSDSPSPADAVLVLGGAIDLRPLAAADLYKRGFAGRVLVAEVAPSPAHELEFPPSEGALTRTILEKLGVPSDAIVPFGKDVTSTYDEARALAAWAVETGAKRVIVPTDLFHTRRVKWAFSRELAAPGVHVEVLALTPHNYGLSDWWRHGAGLVAFNNEIIKYLYYRIKYSCALWRADPSADSQIGEHIRSEKVKFVDRNAAK